MYARHTQFSLPFWMFTDSPEVHPQLSPVVGRPHGQNSELQLQIQPEKSHASMFHIFLPHIVLLHVISSQEKHERALSSHFADEETEGQ